MHYPNCLFIASHSRMFSCLASACAYPRGMSTSTFAMRSARRLSVLAAAATRSTTRTSTNVSCRSLSMVRRPISASLRALRSAHLINAQRSVPQVAAPLVRFYSTDLPEHMVIEFPALSPTMTTGGLQSWNVAVGDTVEAGDSLAEVETDKATMSFDSAEDGIIAKLLIEEGAQGVEIGTPVLVMVTEESDVAAFADYTPPVAGATKPAAAEETPKAEPSPAPTTTSTSAPSQQPTASTSSGDRIFASPLAKRLAEQASIALANVPGTGPRGRITKADVDSYTASAPSAPAATSSTQQAVGATSYVDVPASNVRQVIANRLQESKQQVPHYYLQAEINMDKVMDLRKQFNADANGEYKLSVNDFIIKASSLALKRVKEVNSSWMGNFIREYQTVDISVAVSTDGGLITPIVFDADLKGLVEISTDVKELANRARDGKLTPEEYQGGTFTISNLGMFGVNSFSAIINPPQACILAVGATEQRVVPDPTASNGMALANMMSATLSCDHRVVDGAVGAQWLKEFKKYVENPLAMLL
eukprot:m.355737 g.355737  ORF g.355737 m.355737 type:complete len:533 (+) comp17326_c0_seq1:160-1758(+)